MWTQFSVLYHEIWVHPKLNYTDQTEGAATDKTDPLLRLVGSGGGGLLRLPHNETHQTTLHTEL